MDGFIESVAGDVVCEAEMEHLLCDFVAGVRGEQVFMGVEPVHAGFAKCEFAHWKESE